MEAVAKRFERRPIESRVGAVPDVFSSMNSRFKGTESRSEPRVRFRLATGEFGNYWCMFVKSINQSISLIADLRPEGRIANEMQVK